MHRSVGAQDRRFLGDPFRQFAAFSRRAKGECTLCQSQEIGLSVVTLANRLPTAHTRPAHANDRHGNTYLHLKRYWGRTGGDGGGGLGGGGDGGPRKPAEGRPCCECIRCEVRHQLLHLEECVDRAQQRDGVDNDLTSTMRGVVLQRLVTPYLASSCMPYMESGVTSSRPAQSVSNAQLLSIFGLIVHAVHVIVRDVVETRAVNVEPPASRLRSAPIGQSRRTWCHHSASPCDA